MVAFGDKDIPESARSRIQAELDKLDNQIREMEATAMQPDANPKKLEASEPPEMPPGALELATAISVNRVEKGHQELTSQERSQREQMQRSISKRLAARKAEKREQEEAPSMEEAMALLADGADAVAPS